MTNDKSAEEIVRGLRRMADTSDDYGGYTAEECERAIALIESLTAQLAEAKEALKSAKVICDTAITQLTASQQRERAAVEDMHRLHSLCMDIGGCCPECGDQIDTLMDAACDFCKKSGVNCWVDTPGDESKCAAFEWRGPQEESFISKTIDGVETAIVLRHGHREAQHGKE